MMQREVAELDAQGTSSGLISTSNHPDGRILSHELLLNVRLFLTAKRNINPPQYSLTFVALNVVIKINVSYVFVTGLCSNANCIHVYK
jgi:hypothetical protein